MVDSSVIQASKRAPFRRYALYCACFGLGLGWALFLWSTHPSPWADGEAYWLAAERLRQGADLYLPGSPADPTVYRYAPWFAWAWVPLTYLPKLVVIVGWQVFLGVCSVEVCWRFRTNPIAAFSFPMLVVTSLFGNVQPAILAALVFLPHSLGIAASLKPVALGIAVVRRDWVGLAVGVAVTGVLWAPALFYDLSGYPSVRGLSPYDPTFLLALLTRDHLRPVIGVSRRRADGLITARSLPNKDLEVVGGRVIRRP
jgi:hypothetical protein